MTRKKGLGRGLAALIPESNDQSVVLVGLDKIRPRQDQPRKEFKEEKIQELAQSIKENGLIQPIVLRKKEDYYEIVAGERRFRAFKLLGKKEIPALVRELNQEEVEKLALIENIQREDLSPIEEAMAYRSLMDTYKLTQEDLAKLLGKPRSNIGNSLRLLRLPEEIMDLIGQGVLSQGHGKVLLSLKDEKAQIDLGRRAVKSKLSVRDLEDLIKESKKEPQKTREKDPILEDIEARLRTQLATRVKLIPGRKKGRIEIDYYGDSDLERILDLISPGFLSE